MEWSTAGLLTLLGGLVGFGVRLIATGRWIPRAVHEDARQDWQSRVAELATERDYWRTAAETRAAQVDLLLEGNQTAAAFFRALKAGTDSP